VPHPLMSPVEGTRITGEEGPHAPGQGATPRADQEVGMVRQEGPGVDGGAPASARAARRATKSARSTSSEKMTRRSSPRAITWWSVLGASKRACRGMVRRMVAESE
jgi:hypothetical protein